MVPILRGVAKLVAIGQSRRLDALLKFCKNTIQMSRSSSANVLADKTPPARTAHTHAKYPPAVRATLWIRSKETMNDAKTRIQAMLDAARDQLQDYRLCRSFPTSHAKRIENYLCGKINAYKFALQCFE